MDYTKQKNLVADMIFYAICFPFARVHLSISYLFTNRQSAKILVSYLAILLSLSKTLIDVLQAVAHVNVKV